VRIVSLLPSATEFVCALELVEQLVGVTHECDYSPFVAGLPKVTRTLIPIDVSSARIDTLVRERLKTEQALYSLDLPTLEQLQPDLIVTQALCDVCAVAEDEVRSAACRLPGAPRVVNLEPTTLAGVLQSLETVAQAAGRPERASAALTLLQARIDAVVVRSKQLSIRPRVLLLEWLDPPFSCGHWSPELVQLAGGTEVLGIAGERSRTLEWEEVLAAGPEVLVIACCGFTVERTMQDLPLLTTQPGFADLPAVREERVYVVDGSAYFSRPGPRLIDSLEILAHALEPFAHPLTAGVIPARRLTHEILTASG
jgi:iron complex transport system substrate-binding protein